MKVNLHIFLWLTVLLLGFGCRGVTSQTQSTSNKVEIPTSEELSAETNTNSKYGLALLFDTDAKDQTNRVILRNDKTKQEFDTFHVVDTSARNLWSPDEEYLILGNSYSFYIYKVSKLLKLSNNPKIGKADFFEKAQTTDEISITNKKTNQEFRHTFIKWADNNSFIFTTTNQEWNEKTKNNEIGEFRYDFVKRKLYRRVKQADESFSPEEKQKYLGSISGQNKKGMISESSIENELIK